MKVRTLLLITAGVAIAYVGYKAYCGGFTLMGNNNPLNPAENKIEQPVTDERKLQLQGIITTLNAKLDGVIATNENKADLQRQLDAAVKEINS